MEVSKIWANQEYSCIMARRHVPYFYLQNSFFSRSQDYRIWTWKEVVWKLLWALKAQDNFMDNRIKHFWVLYLNATFGIQAICWQLLFMFITNKEQGEEKQTAIAEAGHWILCAYRKKGGKRTRVVSSSLVSKWVTKKWEVINEAWTLRNSLGKSNFF